ncbi:MAG: PIN domain-containing protein [Paludibacteraceae bacterium]|nr:PIN domain-containing protein [Paludibacteraceae bacterium]
MNRFYLDTNILYFILFDIDSLSRNVRNLMEDYTSAFYASSLCVMELIQLILTRRSFDNRLKEFDLFSTLDNYGIEIKHTTNGQLKTLFSMPVLHSDPVDRLIIAQAATDRIPLISSDNQFAQYTKHLQHFEFIHNRR